MILVFKKVKIVIVLLLTSVIVFSVFALNTSHLAATSGATDKKRPIYSVESNDSKLALTFDAAWGTDKTKGILDILDSYGIKATFFLVGFWIDKNPEVTKEIYDRGHQVANHSNNHLKMSTLSSNQIITELKNTDEKLKNVIGQGSLYFRAPFGDYNNRLITEVENLNMYAIQWDVDSHDWMKKTSSQISERVLSKAKDGSIILFHNNSDYVLEFLPVIILGLKNKGYNFLRVDELVIKGDYYVDFKGVQHKA